MPGGTETELGGTETERDVAISKTKHIVRCDIAIVGYPVMTEISNCDQVIDAPLSTQSLWTGPAACMYKSGIAALVVRGGRSVCGSARRGSPEDEGAMSLSVTNDRHQWPHQTRPGPARRPHAGRTADRLPRDGSRTPAERRHSAVRRRWAGTETPSGLQASGSDRVLADFRHRGNTLPADTSGSHRIKL